jgi:hypothetical protein
MYNRKNLKVAIISAISALTLSNLMLLYPGMGLGFVSIVFGSGMTTPMSYYAFVPFLTLMALIIVNFKELVAAFDYKGIFADFIDVSKRQHKKP